MYRIKKPNGKSGLLKRYINARRKIRDLKKTIEAQRNIMVAKQEKWEKTIFSNLEAIKTAKAAYEALKQSFNSTKELYGQERMENKELRKQIEELRKRLKEHGIAR